MSTCYRPSTLRERRKQETRDQIRRVALQLVQDRGYDGVTVDLISEHAGVSVRTFFNYYSNKESAMIAAPPPLPAQAVENFLGGSGPRDLFADLAELAVTQLEDGGPYLLDFEASIQIVMGVPALAKLQIGAFIELETQFTELITTRLKLDEDDERPAVIAAVFLAAVRVAGQRWSRNPNWRSLAEEVRACLTLLSAMEPNLTPPR